MPLKKKPSSVEIKGFGSDINIILSSESPFPNIERELIRKLEKSRAYLAGTDIVLDARDRILSIEECQKLDMILRTVFELQVAYIKTDSEETKKSAKIVEWKTEDEILKEKAEQEKEGFYEPEINAKTVEIVRNTIRSGQKEYYSGSVVIIGDINPGGEVEAGGDIIVFGKLRGIAHAGSNGDTSATIIAIGLNPLQLRIAGIYRRSPDSESEPESVPEIARIKDGNIVIESIDKYKRGD